MPHPRQFNFIDRCLDSADRALRTLVPGSSEAGRSSPAGEIDASTDAGAEVESARLMRVNHTGEVCAQALYQGQALTAKNPSVRIAMEQAASEEVDHLVWCEQRLEQLDSHTSYLNPLFYAGSFTLGALAGLISDRVSLGFVAATEDQVCEHLRDHLDRLGEQDAASRAILEQMLIDEARHGEHAIAQGGMEFSGPVKSAMTAMSQIMTRTTYWL